MKWPWHRDQTAETEALAKAERELAEVEDRWPHVHEAVESMRVHRQRNHFAESIAAIYAGRDK